MQLSLPEQALLLHAQEVAMGAGTIGDERRPGVLRRASEARVVRGQVDLAQEPVGTCEAGLPRPAIPCLSDTLWRRS